MPRKKINRDPQRMTKTLFKFYTVKKISRETGEEVPYVDGDEEKEVNWGKFEFEIETIDNLGAAFDYGRIEMKSLLPYIQKVISENPQYEYIYLNLDINRDGDVGNPYLEGTKMETQQEVEERIKREEQEIIEAENAKLQKQKEKEEKKKQKEIEMLAALKQKYNS